MERVAILELKKTLLADNDADADKLRQELRNKGVFYVNIMSSPGAGKTTTLLQTIHNLQEHFRVGVMEADIDSDVDARIIANTHTQVIQLHTGGMCHLDADMSRQGMKALNCENMDFVFLENVGNLVCPAEFDTGACLDIVILSVPEGDDKPLKYPLIFEKCQGVLINKIDSAPAFDFDITRATKHILKCNPKAKVFPISAKTGEGIESWCEWLSEKAANWKKR